MQLISSKVQLSLLKHSGKKIVKHQSFNPQDNLELQFREIVEQQPVLHEKAAIFSNHVCASHSLKLNRAR